MRQVPMVVLVTILGLSLVPSTVRADDDRGIGSHQTVGENKDHSSFSATITTSGRGVRIEVRGRQQLPGQEGPPGNSQNVASGSPNTVSNRTGSAGQGPSASLAADGQRWVDPGRGYFWAAPDGHVYSVEGVNIGNSSTTLTDRSAHPNSVPMAFNVDGQFQGIVWLPTGVSANDVQITNAGDTGTVAQAPGTGIAGARDVAVQALSQISLPNLKVRVNPGLGLVAVPGWFWVEGYDGQPISTSRTVSLPPEVGSDVSVDDVPADDSRRSQSSYTVQVSVRPSRYEWSFGDGKTETTQSLGKAYPSESDIKHTYEFSSLKFSEGFPIKVKVEFAAEYRVNNGSPTALSPIQRTYEANYRVQEAQAILASR
jgi:hypothetical protein